MVELQWFKKCTHVYEMDINKDLVLGKILLKTNEKITNDGYR